MNGQSQLLRPTDLEWSERTGGPRVEFVLTPSRMGALPVLVFAGVWDSFLVFFYLAMRHSPRGPSLLLLFPLMHVLVGVAVTWAALVKTLNQSRITIDGEAFVIRQEPIRARGCRVATPDVERFELHERRVPDGDSSCSALLIRREGKPLRLPLQVDQRAHLVFVVAKLNAALADARKLPSIAARVT